MVRRGVKRTSSVRTTRRIEKNERNEKVIIKEVVSTIFVESCISIPLVATVCGIAAIGWIAYKFYYNTPVKSVSKRKTELDLQCDYEDASTVRFLSQCNGIRE